MRSERLLRLQSSWSVALACADPTTGSRVFEPAWGWHLSLRPSAAEVGPSTVPRHEVAPKRAESEPQSCMLTLKIYIYFFNIQYNSLSLYGIDYTPAI